MTRTKALKAGGQKNLVNLRTLKGLTWPTSAKKSIPPAGLEVLDDTLVPSAQNAELKALLIKVRPAFVTHLEHAKQLQSSAGNK